MQTLNQIADQKKLIIAVGYMLRSSPAVIAAKQLMQEVLCLVQLPLARLVLLLPVTLCDQHYVLKDSMPSTLGNVLIAMSLSFAASQTL